MKQLIIVANEEFDSRHLALFPSAITERRPLAEVLSAYAAVMKLSDRIDLRLEGPDVASVAVLVRELDAVEHLLTQAGDYHIVFYPSELALMDLVRRGRETLVAARNLPVGKVLSPDDLAIEVGGRGVGVERSSLLLGKKLVYALTAGEALDFGVIERC